MHLAKARILCVTRVLDSGSEQVKFIAASPRRARERGLLRARPISSSASRLWFCATTTNGCFSTAIRGWCLRVRRAGPEASLMAVFPRERQFRRVSASMRSEIISNSATRWLCTRRKDRNSTRSPFHAEQRYSDTDAAKFSTPRSAARAGPRSSSDPSDIIKAAIARRIERYSGVREQLALCLSESQRDVTYARQFHFRKTRPDHHHHFQPPGAAQLPEWRSHFRFWETACTLCATIARPARWSWPEPAPRSVPARILSTLKSRRRRDEQQQVFSKQAGKRMPRLIGRVFDVLANLDIVTIGAINGYAVGGGWSWALAFDFCLAVRPRSSGFLKSTCMSRIAARPPRFSPRGSAHGAQRKRSWCAATTGRPSCSRSAWSIESWSPTSWCPAAQELARTMAAKPAEAIANSKRDINAVFFGQRLFWICARAREHLAIAQASVLRFRYTKCFGGATMSVREHIRSAKNSRVAQASGGRCRWPLAGISPGHPRSAEKNRRRYRGQRIRFVQQGRREGALRHARAAQERSRRAQEAFWSVPTRNTLDRATELMPRLLYERLDEFGIDFTVLYPTSGLGVPFHPDPKTRRITCSAFNTFVADYFGEFSDRMTPAAVIPMHTPEEAIEELEHAVKKLGLKVVMMASMVRRRNSGDADAGGAHPVRLVRHARTRQRVWLWSGLGEMRRVGSLADLSFGLARNRDFACRPPISSTTTSAISRPRARRCARRCSWAAWRAAFRLWRWASWKAASDGLAGSTSDLIGHWKKRNREALEEVNPANLDTAKLAKLVGQYGGRWVEQFRDNRKRSSDPICTPNIGGIKELDDYAACGIKRPEDIRDLFVNNFYFGCEADDPLNAYAFNRKAQSVRRENERLVRLRHRPFRCAGYEGCGARGIRAGRRRAHHRRRLPRLHVHQSGALFGRGKSELLQRHACGERGEGITQFGRARPIIATSTSQKKRAGLMSRPLSITQSNSYL